MVEEHVTPQGEKLYVQVIKTPVYDALGRVTRTQGIFWDVTEKYRAQEDLRQAYAELAEKERELLKTMGELKNSHEELIQAQMQLIQAEKLESVGRLAAGVAHEVKNPLAVLLMGLDYLKGACERTTGADVSESDEGTVAQVIVAMHDAVERADSIVRGLVDFSANRQLDLVAQDVEAVIAQSLVLVKHELTNAHVAVVQERHPADESREQPRLPQVTLDAMKIQQVLVNLYMNAIHAMGDGYDVYVVTDASGGVSPEAHDMGIRRVQGAGAQPITWLGMAGELQRDWARTERLGEVAEIFIDHAGATGSVFLWETQLLRTSQGNAV